MEGTFRSFISVSSFFYLSKFWRRVALVTTGAHSQTRATAHVPTASGGTTECALAGVGRWTSVMEPHGSASPQWPGGRGRTDCVAARAEEEGRWSWSAVLCFSMMAQEPGPIWSKMKRATTTVEAITPFIVEMRELRRGYSRVTAVTRGVTQLRVWRGNPQLLVQR